MLTVKPMTDKGVIIDDNMLSQLHANGAIKVWDVLLNGPISGTKPCNTYDDVDLIVRLGCSQYVQGRLHGLGCSGLENGNV